MAAAWFEKGRPALFEALSNVCDQIGRDLAAGKPRERGHVSIEPARF